MAVVFADANRVESAIGGATEFVSIAATNGPENTVISGDKTKVEAIVAGLDSVGVKSTMLEVSHAFHSPLMEPMLDEFERLAGTIEYHSPRLPIVSNLTGRLAEQGTYNATYWRDHVRNTVRFQRCSRCACRRKDGRGFGVGANTCTFGHGKTLCAKL